MACIESLPGRAGSPFVFPADWGDGHFIGVVRVLDRFAEGEAQGCDASRAPAYLR